MKLSVIICCYNEQETIADVIERTRRVELGPGWEREILVVDNFSTDGTRDILQKIDDPQVRVILHERNMGKGMSIRTGIAHMTGDYMIIQDADKEYDPAEHPKFCRKV
ncbi:MAG: glycosyltransferase family 2 protein, partial [Anaerolineales bacterium]|nr:glycosyltransferase family 2 protein [Anaerolineales bacterium]